MSAKPAEVFKPTPDTPGEPYFAIMHVDDKGRTDGNLWSFGKRVMLFFDRDVAGKIHSKLGVQDKNNKYGIFGVTEPHLAAIRDALGGTEVAIFVVLEIHANGQIEAVPLEEHIAELPPPLPPPPG